MKELCGKCGGLGVTYKNNIEPVTCARCDRTGWTERTPRSDDVPEPHAPGTLFLVIRCAGEYEDFTELPIYWCRTEAEAQAHVMLTGHAVARIVAEAPKTMDWTPDCGAGLPRSAEYQASHQRRRDYYVEASTRLLAALDPNVNAICEPYYRYEAVPPTSLTIANQITTLTQIDAAGGFELTPAVLAAAVVVSGLDCPTGRMTDARRPPCALLAGHEGECM